MTGSNLKGGGRKIGGWIDTDVDIDTDIDIEV